jgi:TrpR family trp operon transcriptional repressor
MFQEHDGWHCFLELCLAAKDEKTIASLFDLFFTAEEKASLSTRCLIVKDLLAQNKTQRQIAQDLHVSIAKITRGSNELKRTPDQLKEFLQEKLSQLKE